MSRLLIISAVLMFTASAEAETLKLSFRDALGMALENNNQIKAASFGSQAAWHGVKSVTARYFPTLVFEETLTASNSPTNTFMMKLD